jgi:hypothetical protein
MGPAIEGGVIVAEAVGKGVASAAETVGTVAAEAAEAAAKTAAEVAESSAEGALGAVESGAEMIEGAEIIPNLETGELLSGENFFRSENFKLESEISANEQWVSDVDNSLFKSEGTDPAVNRINEFFTSQENPEQIMDSLRGYDSESLSSAVREIETGNVENMRNVLERRIEPTPPAYEAKIYDTIDPAKMTELENILSETPREYGVDSVKDAPLEWTPEKEVPIEHPVERPAVYEVDEKQRIEADTEDVKEFKLAPDATQEQINEARNEHLRKEFAKEINLPETSGWDDVFNTKELSGKKIEYTGEALSGAEKEYHTQDTYVEDLMAKKDTDGLREFMVSKKGRAYFGERFKQVDERKAMELVNEEMSKVGKPGILTEEQIKRTVAENHSQRLQTKEAPETQPETKTQTETKEKTKTETLQEKDVKRGVERGISEEGRAELIRQKYAGSVVYNLDENTKEVGDVKIALVKTNDFWTLPESAIDPYASERQETKKVILEQTGLDANIQTKISQETREVSDEKNNKAYVEFQCFLAKSESNTLPPPAEGSPEVKWFSLHELSQNNLPVNKNSLLEIKRSIEIIRRRENLN